MSAASSGAVRRTPGGQNEGFASLQLHVRRQSLYQPARPGDAGWNARPDHRQPGGRSFAFVMNQSGGNRLWSTPLQDSFTDVLTQSKRLEATVHACNAQARVHPRRCRRDVRGDRRVPRREPLERDGLNLHPSRRSGRNDMDSSSSSRAARSTATTRGRWHRLSLNIPGPVRSAHAPDPPG